MRLFPTRRGGDEEAAAPESSYLRLDGARCDGHGICALRLPGYITLDEWGYAVIDRRSLERPEDLRRARRAVRACPAAALELTTDRRDLSTRSGAPKR